VQVQPVAIAYTKMHGVALGRYFRPEAAWPGDVALASHVANIVKQGALDVELHFGEPIVFDVNSNRKIITRQIEDQVRQMLNTSLRGTKPLVLDGENTV
jgi:1-acyl-sn-glycerol-3-phosphate acyltransferase